ncbi:Trehalose synthase/amylase TreS [Legionella beliardensis]|uniref:maltose alpha-D-glucosyltransferase n=1 Tax=Legionella beliardensis TaxID=91822 RepID=A0A378HZP1_9GAMM|nr:maltose alpha-D-glucosyltransferase [Legionella beliardensis]STX27855.1 Trehalose synthase/amylase TreS [Legionella beliardensis]
MTEVKQAEWYKDAIIYQIHVRSFYDSNDDGIGDFKGLIQKLDYIEFLGVNTIWLLPFYPSPLKDEGYDIADYMSINPIYGTLRDFKKFLKEAHARNIRVITELVINHTSSQHEWFIKSRSAKPGSYWRNFYVWSDTAEEYADARIIFRDFEPSNWTWDHVANAYYWHRFYSHQPDLNYDNPAVQKEIFKIVDFWLGLGVDGLRLDAIPYLFQREGTNCENLPETHQFLKKLSRHITSKFENRFLLAEANQWPEDAVNYFGKGDECQMAFHFPLMPRMYMAVQMEDRFPIIDIIEQTPSIPDNCQWAIFLRNHDELTLEMVTDEERDYMYRMYGQDQQMRINLGIRRRLAPLMGGDRRKIELLNALLFSMPGTPVMYYGDEIGMGDNIYLGDRNGVRTPMQWSNDNNAGFSNATPQKLYLPVIIDPEYNYQAVNVTLQQQNSQSLLWWMKRLIEVRNSYTAFSQGRIEFLYPDNNKIIAFYRMHQEQLILVLINLSRFTQSFKLDLSNYVNHSITEVFGRTSFPIITEAPYFFVLCPYGFLWLEINKPDIQHSTATAHRHETLTIKDKWCELLASPEKKKLEKILAHYIVDCRWFRSKNYAISKIVIADSILIKNSATPVYLLLIAVEFNDKETEQYFMFVTAETEEENLYASDQPAKIICSLISKNKKQSYLIDAMYTSSAWQDVFHIFSAHKILSGTHGKLEVNVNSLYKKIVNHHDETVEIKALAVEQSNTSILYGKSALLKIYRRCEFEENPEVEISEFLTDNSEFKSPRIACNLKYHYKNKSMTVGIVQEYIPNAGNAWEHTVNAISNLIEQMDLSVPAKGSSALNYPWQKLIHTLPKDITESLGLYAHSVIILAERTAQMHIALAEETTNKFFAAEHFTLFDQRSLYQSLRNAFIKTSALFKSMAVKLDDQLQEKINKHLADKDGLLDHVKPILNQKIGGKKIRCHGDYHLGQILYTGNDFIIIDYEGEPNRPLSERKIKRPPLKDIAGILRSFHYALYTVLNNKTVFTTAHHFDAEEWYCWICHLFINTYLEYPGIKNLMPKDNNCFSLLLKALMFEKVLHEIEYEINNRPDWLHVPCKGLIQLLE